MDKHDRVYRVELRGLPEYVMLPTPEAVRVAAGEIEDVALNVRVNPDLLAAVNTPIMFDVVSLENDIRASSPSTFIGPRPLP